MKKIAVEVLERAPDPDGHIRATLIFPCDLSLPERLNIAEAILQQIQIDHAKQSKT